MQNGKTGESEEFVPDAGDDFTPEEQAAIERMQRETPMPEKNEGGDPPAGSETPDGKQDTGREADTDADADLVEGEEEISVDGQGRAHDRDGKFVSKSAFLRVKEQRKADREALDAERLSRAKLESRLDILTEIINSVPGEGKTPDNKEKPANPWEEPDIDPTADIFGAFEQQKRRNAYERQQREGLVTSQGQRDRQLATVNAYVADAKRVAAENIKNGELVTLGEGEQARQVPAFQAAYLHVVAMRHAQLEALGITDKAQRDARIAQEEQALVEEAVAAKRSPAEMIYGLAKAMGFKVPAKGAGNGKANGKTPAQTEAERQLAAVNKGMQATQSLSGKGGQAYGGVTRAQIIAMDDAAFDAFTSKLSEDQINRMLGAD